VSSAASIAHSTIISVGRKTSFDSHPHPHLHLGWCSCQQSNGPPLYPPIRSVSPLLCAPCYWHLFLGSGILYCQVRCDGGLERKRRIGKDWRFLFSIVSLYPRRDHPHCHVVALFTIAMWLSFSTAMWPSFFPLPCGHSSPTAVWWRVLPLPCGSRL